MCRVYHLAAARACIRIPPPAVIARFLTSLLILLAAPAAAQAGADSLALDGPWRFRAGDAAAWAQPGLDDGGWRTMEVPGVWEAGLGEYDGFGWYRREVRLPESLRGEPLGLRFGTVGDAFEVYWNGVRIGVATVSSGKPGYQTPTGVFTILQKDAKHRSSKYHSAPMPYQQRLTWDTWNNMVTGDPSLQVGATASLISDYYFTLPLARPDAQLPAPP